MNGRRDGAGVDAPLPPEVVLDAVAEDSGGRAGAGADDPVPAVVNAVLGAVAEDSGGRGVADVVSGGLEAVAEDSGGRAGARAAVLPVWGSGAYEYAARAAGTREAPGAWVLVGAGDEADAGVDGLAAGVTHALSAGRVPPPGSSCSRM